MHQQAAQIFFCHTGVVFDPIRDREHIVRCGDLPNLYQVPRSLCKMIDSMEDVRGYNEEQLKEIIHLFPRSSGDYSRLPRVGVIESA